MQREYNKTWNALGKAGVSVDKSADGEVKKRVQIVQRAEDKQIKHRIRTCIVTRQQHADQDMLRFVLAPDGTLVCDYSEKLPGRGAWVFANKAIIEAAIAKKAFERAFKTNTIAIPSNLSDTVQEDLKKRTLQALSLSRKAGHLVRGRTKVEAALASGQSSHLIYAKEASEQSLKDIRSSAGNQTIEETDLFCEDELTDIFGGTRTLFCALSVNGKHDHTTWMLKRLKNLGNQTYPSQSPKKKLENTTDVKD